MLKDATREQLANIDLLFDGVCWPDLNECLSVEGMLQGRHPIPWTQKEWKATVEKLRRKYPIQG